MRSAELSRALVAPAGPALDGATCERIRERLVVGVATEVERLPEGEELEIDRRRLRQVLSHPELLLEPAEPFVWRPSFVRRSLGLALVAACATGRFRSPAEAAEPITADAVDEWSRTGWKTFHWEPWFAGLEQPARAVVLAEGVSWATALWTSFDWALLGDDVRFGGPDAQWVLPAPRVVRLKGRTELRTTTMATPTGAGEVDTHALSLVAVSGGGPGPGWWEELVFLAVVALRTGARALPARVTGLWPDAGISRVVEIDGPALDRGVDQLLGAVATLVDVRVSGLAAR